MQLSGLLSELPVASRVVRTHRRWQSLQRAAPRVAAAAMQPQQQQQPYSSSPQADDVLPSDHGALVQRWEELLQSSLGVYAERHTQNRKHRLTAHRLEMERIQAALPAHVAAGLTDRLVAVRASGARERKQRLEEARLCGPKVVVDCGFAVEHCRPGLETRSLAKQVEWAMAANKSSQAPVDLHVVGWTGEVAAFGRHIGADGWGGITQHERPLLDVFPTQQLVVLSPDAEEPLTRLEPDCVYVVGGIVDRSVRKGVTSEFAEQNRLRCVRLPIFEHAAALGMTAATKGKVRVVLNVSDVVIALVEFHNSGDWAKALTAAIPERKRRPQQPRQARPRARSRSPTGGDAAAAAEASGEEEEEEQEAAVRQASGARAPSRDGGGGGEEVPGAADDAQGQRLRDVLALSASS